MSIKKAGFLQALGVTFYCSLVGLLFWQGNHLFPKVNQYFAPVVMLLLLSVSVLICGLLVFYKPYRLFFAGKKKDAINIVLSTSFWLFAFLFVFFLLMVIFK
jgi:hypothetical protein